ncbi:MAG: class I SAM-dependent methyltransferase [Verrucomicrobiota bacterium]
MNNSDFEDCFALMQSLVEYRARPIYPKLQTIGKEHSMLHLDVLTLIYHFSKICAGDILEIGSYVGGSTIAAAFGVRDSDQRKTIVTIEPGGRLEHPRLPTKNIFKDLRKNLARNGVADLVTLIEGCSMTAETVTAVRQRLVPGGVGLLIIDADGNVERDLDIYRDLLAAGCWVVIDDYFMPGRESKDVLTKPQVNQLVDAGELHPLGLYGWGTWVGRWAPKTVSVI